MFKLDNGMKVYFKHLPEEWGYLTTDEEGVDRNPETPYKGKTTCYIDDELSGEALREGVAFCSINDRFDKARGRKLSLTRAIEGLDKDLRKEFWTAYLAVTSRR